MARAKRTESAETSFSIKFSTEERELIGRLVEARSQELREAGITEPVTIASLLRWLVHQNAQARGLEGGARVARTARDPKKKK